MSDFHASRPAHMATAQTGWPVAQALSLDTRGLHQERYAKLPLMILLHRADLRLPRSLILKTEGFA